MQLELVCVECDRLHGVLDLELDIAGSLIGPWFARLEVEEGDRIVDRFYAGKYLSVLSLRIN